MIGRADEHDVGGVAEEVERHQRLEGGPISVMYYAHSTEDPDRDRWQRLSEHLANVSREAASRAEHFGTGWTAVLGKYAPAFQAYISGNGESPNHATAGAREILALGIRGKDGFAAENRRLMRRRPPHRSSGPDRRRWRRATMISGRSRSPNRLRRYARMYMSRVVRHIDGGEDE